MVEAVKKENYIFDGIKSKKAQQELLAVLKSCKEIRDTAYPLDNSVVTELKILDLHAQKQKDYIYVTGTLKLEDNDEVEMRTFEAYITNKEKESHVLLDITRMNNKNIGMIRTTDIITEKNDNIISITSYCGNDFLENKVFSTELPKESFKEVEIKVEQLSVL